MIFTPENADKVMKGRKTQTRRVKSGNYVVGKDYAVCPGRGKKSIGRIKILRKWEHKLWDMTDDERIAEGVYIPKDPANPPIIQ